MKLCKFNLQALGSESERNLVIAEDDPPPAQRPETPPKKSTPMPNAQTTPRSPMTPEASSHSNDQVGNDNTLQGKTYVS